MSHCGISSSRPRSSSSCTCIDPPRRFVSSSGLFVEVSQYGVRILSVFNLDAYDRFDPAAQVKISQAMELGPALLKRHRHGNRLPFRHILLNSCTANLHMGCSHADICCCGYQYKGGDGRYYNPGIRCPKWFRTALGLANRSLRLVTPLATSAMWAAISRDKRSGIRLVQFAFQHFQSYCPAYSSS